MKGAALLIMEGDLVPVPALLAIGAVLGQGVMTTPLPRGERRHIVHLLPGVCQKSMMKITSGDPILLPVEMMLIMVMRRGPPHQTVTDPLHTGGLPGSTRDHLQDPGSRSADGSPARSD
uniref:Uncharacterized protein n=1 Tax=Arundo donax TaxID=35708 RepID=A0A0A9AAE9_ARUDO